MLDEVSVSLWSLSAAALFLKMLSVAMIQGYQRIKNKAFVKPEDAAVFGRGEPLKEELPLVQLGQSALRNDLENIPIFLALSLGYVLLGCWPMGAFIYFPIFVVSRIFHTAFYLSPRQPWRTLSYSAGMITMLALTVHIAIGAISKL